MNKFKLSLIAGVMALSFAAYAEFKSGMTADQVAAEVQQQLADGKSVDQIVASAKEIGISVSSLASALISQGQSSDAVTASLEKAGFDKDQVKLAVTVAAAGPTAAGNQGNQGNNFSGSNGSTLNGGGGASRS